MWPFSRWRTAREKAFIRKAFGRYVAPETLERIVDEAETLKAPPPRRMRMDFIVVQVRDDVLDDIPRHLERAFECVVASGAFLPNMMLPYLIVSYERGNNLPTPLTKHTVDRLLAVLGRNARLVFGTADGLVGSMGTQQVWYFGPAISNLSRAFQELMKLEFGTASEVAL